MAIEPTTAQQMGAVGQESSLSNWAGDYVTDMLGKGWAASEMPYFAYQGPLTAGPSALQQQAFQGIGSLALPSSVANYTAGQYGSSFSPSNIQGKQYTGNTFETDVFGNAAAQQYMNPYLQQALNPQLDEMRRQSEITRLGDAARMTQAGAFGGSRQAILESELNNALMRNQAQVTGEGYRDAYDKAMGQFNIDQQRLLEALGMTESSRQFADRLSEDSWRFAQGQNEASRQFANTSQRDMARLNEMSRQFGANLGLQGLGSMLDIGRLQAQMGETQRGIEQQGIDADYAQFREERDFPYKQVQFMQSLLQGLPLEAQNYEFMDPTLIELITQGAAGGGELWKIISGLFGGSGGTDFNWGTPPETPPEIETYD
jgi:hypothetical protein